jgi:hypothetical protein
VVEIEMKAFVIVITSNVLLIQLLKKRVIFIEHLHLRLVSADKSRNQRGFLWRKRRLLSWNSINLKNLFIMSVCVCCSAVVFSKLNSFHLPMHHKMSVRF